MYKKYTLQQLFDKLNVIECFEETGHSFRIGEILKKQVEKHETLRVEVPTLS